jgi:hypothetical protein
MKPENMKEKHYYQIYWKNSVGESRDYIQVKYIPSFSEDKIVVDYYDKTGLNVEKSQSFLYVSSVDKVKEITYDQLMANLM